MSRYKLLLRLEKQNASFLVLLGFLLIVITGFFDFWTGYEYSFSVFYVLPIMLITWFSNRRMGILASLMCAVLWLAAELFAGRIYSNRFIPIWNVSIRFSSFVIIVILLTAIKFLFQEEKKRAYTDYLTSAINSRSFHELIQVELYRAHRNQQPLTFAFLDIDDFKAINDQFGHAAGDETLRSFVGVIKANIRKTDLIARLGGDEFAILLPNTNPETARVVLSKIKNVLEQNSVQQGFAITFSAGVITYVGLPKDGDELIKIADDLMYKAKSQGKNVIFYGVYKGTALDKEKTNPSPGSHHDTKRLIS